MKRSMKILYWVVLGMLILCALLHLIDGNFSAFGGWLVAACWCANAEMAEESYKAEAKTVDRLYKDCEKYYSRIRELESEDEDDGK